MGIINIFFPDKFAFLPCSTISGSFYIINILDCIIDTKKKEKEDFVTSIIIQIIIIIFSFLYQIYHIKYKDSEEPNSNRIEKYLIENSNINREICDSNPNQDNEFKQIETKEQSLLNNSKFNTEDNEEEEINDQED